jgi:cell filamentation protein
MYGAAPDPYCYPGTKVLKNRANLRRQADLDEFELAMTTQRLEEGLPAGRLSVSHYCAIHHHLFQDVYGWAGKLRRVRISRGDSTFCYPEHIPVELHKLFTNLRRQDYHRSLAAGIFAKAAAHFLAELNAIHAFRDGNGRAQLVFMSILAFQAGYTFDVGSIRRTPFLRAMIASFKGDERLLAAEMRKLMS